MEFEDDLCRHYDKSVSKAGSIVSYHDMIVTLIYNEIQSQRGQQSILVSCDAWPVKTWMCTEIFLPFNHIESESTFLKAISEISQYQTVFENVLHESKLLNPFDINEEENDITEYHGDLDPVKCYYNHFPHNLIKELQ